MASCCPQFAGCAATAAMLPAILGGRSTAVFCCCRCFSARPVQAGDADDPTAAFVHGPDSAAGRPSAAATDNSAPPLCRLSCAAQPWQRTYTGIFLPIFSSPFGLLTALAVVASVDLVALLFVCQVSCAAASNRRGGAGGPGRPGRRGGPAACAAANTARGRGSSCSGGGQCRGAGRRRCGRAARRGGAGRAGARRAARHLRRQVRRGPRAAVICEAAAARRLACSARARWGTSAGGWCGGAAQLGACASPSGADCLLPAQIPNGPPPCAAGVPQKSVSRGCTVRPAHDPRGTVGVPGSSRHARRGGRRG